MIPTLIQINLKNAILALLIHASATENSIHLVIIVVPIIMMAMSFIHVLVQTEKQIMAFGLQIFMKNLFVLPALVYLFVHGQSNNWASKAEYEDPDMIFQKSRTHYTKSKRTMCA